MSFMMYRSESATPSMPAEKAARLSSPQSAATSVA
uniref:Uncharacterized protein n=1 Tax=Arundo donax TaxID=35708 RepID=A0A0A9EHA2_ARUDO